jgi:hypothetical protein
MAGQFLWSGLWVLGRGGCVIVTRMSCPLPWCSDAGMLKQFSEHWHFLILLFWQQKRGAFRLDF